AEDLVTGFASIFRHGTDVSRHGRPGDQSRLAECSDINVKVVSRLRRVRRDDFKILPAAERNEGVPRAGAGVTSAHDGFHSSHPLNPPNSSIKISYTEQQMIYGSPGGYPVFTRTHCPSKQIGCDRASAPAEHFPASQSQCF